ncbi:MAG TPA: hypothetical protein VF760_04295, partial [Xanthobacteraceae bacterium]
MEFLESVTQYLDMAQPVDLVCLDFPKAFDKVPYARLFKKLRSHGIVGKIIEWVESWLTGRRQRVCINGELSQWTNV